MVGSDCILKVEPRDFLKIEGEMQGRDANGGSKTFGPSPGKDGAAFSHDEEAVSEVRAEGKFRGLLLVTLSLRHLLGTQVSFALGSLTVQTGNPLPGPCSLTLAQGCCQEQRVLTL